MNALIGHEHLALDTSALHYFLAGDAARAPTVRAVLDAAAAGRQVITISVLTVAELRIHPLRAESEKALEAVSALVDDPTRLTVADIDRPLADEAARIRARYNLALVDAVIIATALATGCTAVVGNDSRWKRVRDEITYIHLDDVVNDE